MNDQIEKKFYEAMSVVPEVPMHSLDSIERRLRITGTKRKLLLAACLMLAVVIPAVMIHTNDSASAYASIPESVAEELFHAFEFINGNDQGLMWDLDGFDYDYDYDDDFAADDLQDSVKLQQSAAAVETETQQGGR